MTDETEEKQFAATLQYAVNWLDILSKINDNLSAISYRLDRLTYILSHEGVVVKK